MPSVGFIVADYVCPTIGAVLATLAFAAPIRSLKSALKNGALGPLNPTPWAFMTGNTLGWLAYSFITLDPFVFFANAPGLIISIWLNTGAAKLQYHVNAQCSSSQPTEGDAVESSEKGSEGRAEENAHGHDNAQQKPTPSVTSHEWKVFLIVVIWMAILSVTSLVPIDNDDTKSVVGVAVNLNLVFFYAAPLSTLGRVWRTRSSSSIHCPTMVTNTANAFFWCVYGLAIVDYYILLPNALGLLFGIVQMVAYVAFAQGGATIEEDGTEQFLEGGATPKEGDAESEII